MYWVLYLSPLTRAQAAARFRLRFGRKPTEMKYDEDNGGWWWVGFVSREEIKAAKLRALPLDE